MLDKDKIKKNIDLENEYQELLNFVNETRFGTVILDITINHKGLFSDTWQVLCKKKKISKDALINILEELIKKQDKEFKTIIKKGEE